METYNGTTVLASRRIKAVQELDNLEKDLYHFVEMRRIDKKKKELEEEEQRKKR